MILRQHLQSRQSPVPIHEESRKTKLNFNMLPNQAESVLNDDAGVVIEHRYPLSSNDLTEERQISDACRPAQL